MPTKDQIINLLEHLCTIDKFDVDSKYMEIPKSFDYNDKKNVLSVIWKSRHERRNIGVYDLDDEFEFIDLVTYLNTIIDDMVVDDKPSKLVLK